MFKRQKNDGSLEKKETMESDEMDNISNIREYAGPMVVIVSSIAVIWSIFVIFNSSFGVMMAIKYRSWFLGFLLIMIFLLVPANKKEKRKRKLPTLWDFICIVITIASIAYLLLNYDGFVNMAGLHIPADYWFGGLGLLVTFEAARRTAGLVMTILAALFLSYNFLGSYVPGAFGHADLSVDRVIDNLWWGTQGVFGLVLGVASTYVFLFIVFGAFLRKSGFIDFISDLAMAIAGRTAGGTAKVAVIGSAFMGMINGSGVANTSAVGTVTIPLMKETGFKKHSAAAIEAVAGTGGVIAPPVMGAASFVMAEYLGVPYREIILAALIPAILYFTMCLTSVHFEAKKQGILGLSKSRIPNIWKVLKDGGHLIIPVIVVVVLLLSGTTPLYAAVWSLLSTVIVSWFKKDTRMGFKEIVKAMEEGAKGVLTVGAACAIVGVIIGTISLTSVGLTLGNNILSLAGEHLFLVAIFTMLISIILGMGVPVTASYVITATIAAPILSQMGVPLIVAHMFAFFFAALSDITPPVALSALAASGIARAPFFKVAFTAVRFGFIGFVIPYFFLYNPALLLQGDGIMESVLSGATAFVGVIALAASFAGYFITNLNMLQRSFLIIVGFFMILQCMLTNIIGLILLISIIIWQQIKRKNEGGVLKTAERS